MSQALDLGELTIVMHRTSQTCLYIGTRRQLEAEGIIPLGMVWSDGFGYQHWQAGGLCFSLKRTRPAGAKGPRRDFADCDCWCLQMYGGAPGNNVDAAIKRKEKELARFVYLRSPEGHAESVRMCRLHDAARGDEKFQTFKALVPGLIPRPRKRTSRQAQTEVQGD